MSRLYRHNRKELGLFSEHDIKITNKCTGLLITSSPRTPGKPDKPGRPWAQRHISTPTYT